MQPSLLGAEAVTHYGIDYLHTFLLPFLLGRPIYTVDIQLSLHNLAWRSIVFTIKGQAPKTSTVQR